jgi:serine/threonine-protein kinase HipA
MAVDRLNIWLEAFEQPIGTLQSQPNGNVNFQYAEDYLALPDAMPLSQSLPMRIEAHGDVLTRAWFDNLIQENDSLGLIMAREQIERSDIVSVLAIIGADCPGALSCLVEGAPPVKRPGILGADYDHIADQDLVKIMHELAEKGRPPLDSSDPSPVAGYQPKIAITVLPDGRFALPKKGTNVPTTHILKVPQTADARDVKIESLCMTLAQGVGVVAADVEAREIDGVAGLLIQRFDRWTDNGSVYRLHQEDFAQGLGLSASLKYERNGTAQHKFDIAGIAKLLRATANPTREIERFLDLTLFNLLVGNVDNHAKNHALLYFDQQPVLAPAYDLLATRLNNTLTQDFSFNIGNATKLDELTRADMIALTAAFGLRGQGAVTVLERSARRIAKPLMDQLDAIARVDRRLANYIAYASAELKDIMGWQWLEIPERDAFVDRGGGWQVS